MGRGGRLYRTIRGGLANKMTFEQRPEGSEGANFVVSWKTLPKKGSGSWGKTSVAGVE